MEHKHIQKLLLGAVTSSVLFFSQEVLVQAQLEVETEVSTAEVLADTKVASEDFIEKEGVVDEIVDHGEEVISERIVSDKDHVPEGEVSTRISGENRYTNAVAISEAGYDEAKTVIVANGTDAALADALTGAALADIEEAPLLLTKNDVLGEETKSEIQRLGADKVVFLGGETSVSEKQITELKEIGIETERIGGRNRYEQAAKTAERVMNHVEKVEPSVQKHDVFLVNGEKFSDAMTVAPISAKERMPILLTRAHQLDENVVGLLNRIKKIYLIGGETSLTKAIEEELQAKNVLFERITGSNRYEVNRNVLTRFDVPKNEVYVVSGEVMADGLNTASLAARENKGMMIVKNNNKVEMKKQLEYIVGERGIEQFIVVGGPTTLSKETVKWFDRADEIIEAKDIKKTERLSGTYAVTSNNALLTSHADDPFENNIIGDSSPYFEKIVQALEKITFTDGSESIKVRAENGEMFWLPQAAAQSVSLSQVIYTVKSGDTLQTLSDFFKVTPVEIAQASGISATARLRTGQELSIRTYRTLDEMTVEANKSISNNEQRVAYIESVYTYVVKSGDTVKKLAQRFGITPNKIGKQNNIRSNATLRVGQYLVIPDQHILVTVPNDYRIQPEERERELEKNKVRVDLFKNAPKADSIGRQKVIDWFYKRQHTTYSMYRRNGPTSYDCSSAIFLALIDAGYLPQGTWIGTTESLFALEGRIFTRLDEKDVKAGDIFVNGFKGYTLGSGGHTGVALDNGKTIIHSNYTDNGISISEASDKRMGAGRPNTWYRLIR